MRFTVLRPSVVALQRSAHVSLRTRALSSLPSNTTTLKVLGVPNYITESLLQESLNGVVDARKIELEPGCAVHIMNSAEAEHAKHTLSNASLDSIAQDTCNVINTAMPAIYLDNIPSTMSSEEIHEIFHKTLGQIVIIRKSRRCYGPGAWNDVGFAGYGYGRLER